MVGFELDAFWADFGGFFGELATKLAPFVQKQGAGALVLPAPEMGHVDVFQDRPHGAVEHGFDF